ncbi:hypothetical protein [Streptomyces cyaneofuscatus]|uniref:hypothetical protein n=1 Tax=Streptomyces cyaneofuscatus TaxID=66883 RepID=UPI003662465A
MSENQPVILEGIPVFTGNLALLDTKVTSLTKDGEKISSAAADIHSSFGGLQAFYKAPEADQLFATTKPVADRGASLKSDLATITSALSSYSDDAHPLVEKLKRLKRDAGAFLVKVNADDKWREDGDLVEENNNRHAEIAETWAAFQAVERACHNKIISLVPDGKQLKVDDGSGGKGMYGYDAEALKHAKGLPWGDPVKESTPWYHIHEHLWDFGKGVVVDGVWGTIKGLGTLVGTDGWESMKQAWTGLAKLTTGIIISTTPLAAAFWLTPEDKLPSWLRDSRTAMKETGKALLAWDQWSENPSRAAGAVTFNVVTTVFTGGTGGAVAGGGKAAVAAKALSFAGKAGRAIDPMTYLFKGAGAGLTKISDVMAGLKGMGNIEIPTLPPGSITLPDGGFKLADGTLHLPEGAAVPDGAFEVPKGAVKLPDGMDIPAGAVDLGGGVVRLPEGMTPPAGSLPIPEGALKLPEGTTALPEGTVRGTDKDGNIVHLDREGNILKEDGTLQQHHSAAPDGDPTDGAPIRTDADTPLPRTPAEESALVGAGARTGGGDSIRLGSDFGDKGRLGDDAARTGDNVTAPDRTPGGTATNLPGGSAPDNLPTNSLDNGTPGSTPRDHLPANHLDGGGPTGTGSRDIPGGSAADSGIPNGLHPEFTGPSAPHGGPVSAEDATAATSRENGQPQDSAQHKPTTAEIKAKQDEFIRLANDPDKTWFDQFYRADGHRHSIEVKIDGVELPILAKGSDGSWISKHDLPSASSEVKFGRDELARGSAPVAHIDHFDNIAMDRKVSVDLANAERAHKANPTVETLQKVQKTSDVFHGRLGEEVSNNSGFSERLGEESASLHVVPEKFPDAVAQPLPKTANGANMFDQLYRRAGGKLLIIEAKAPSSGLIWRRGLGEADGLMVKQGTREYLQTIIAEMEARPHLTVTDDAGKVWTNAQLASELDAALTGGTLEYAMVRATEGQGTYAGAVIEHFKI